MIYTKQEFIQKSLEIEESIIAEGFIKKNNEAKISTIDDFQKVIAGKENCIGIEFHFEEQKIGFKFIKANVENIAAYIVAKDIKLNDIEFKAFADNFLNDQPWILKEDGRADSECRLVCIRVVNIETGEKVLVDSEGYTYPRYTSIEE